MRRIGAGWQYTVYEMSNERVLKKPRSTTGRYVYVAGCLATEGATRIFSTNKEIERIEAARRRSASILQARIEHMDDSALLGNPVFHEDGSYEQDKAIPLGDYFKLHAHSENVQKLEGFASLIETLWEYGFNEAVYNFLTNNGVAADGAVVLLDLGELTDAKEDVVLDIESQAWLSRSSCAAMPASLKKDYERIMRERLTLPNLDQRWARRL